MGVERKKGIRHPVAHGVAAAPNSQSVGSTLYTPVFSPRFREHFLGFLDLDDYLLYLRHLAKGDSLFPTLRQRMSSAVWFCRLNLKILHDCSFWIVIWYTVTKLLLNKAGNVGNVFQVEGCRQAEDDVSQNHHTSLHIALSTNVPHLADLLNIGHVSAIYRRAHSMYTRCRSCAS